MSHSTHIAIDHNSSSLAHASLHTMKTTNATETRVQIAPGVYVAYKLSDLQLSEREIHSKILESLSGLSPLIRSFS